jgi:hypothetical protein
MQSVLSLLTGVVLIGLVYGLSFLPTATLARYDDIEVAEDDSAMPDAEDAEAHSDDRPNTSMGDAD